MVNTDVVVKSIRHLKSLRSRSTALWEFLGKRLDSISNIYILGPKDLKYYTGLDFSFSKRTASHAKRMKDIQVGAIFLPQFHSSLKNRLVEILK